MSINLVLENAPTEVAGALFDFSALPGARAVSVVSQGEDYVLARIDSTGPSYLPIGPALIPGLAQGRRSFERAVLSSLGNGGFALVAPEGVVRWRSFDDEPRVFQRVDRFPRNEHGFSVGIAAGASSDECDAALVILREPQVIYDVTRYAWLRFEDAAGTCRWEGLTPQGEPPWLAKEAFPIPPHYLSNPTLLGLLRPILFHASWRGGKLRVFVVGLQGNYERWGMDYSIAAQVGNAGVTATWVADENCFGTYSASGRYLVINPLRAGGPSRGASRLLDLETGELHAVTMPRGLARFQIADHADGLFWIRTRRGESLRLATCRAL